MTASAYTGLVDQWGKPLSHTTGGGRGALHNSFHNSRRDRMRSGTRGPMGSVNAHHDSRSLEDLIRDCTQLGRNSIIARAVMRANEDHVVGDEIIADPRTEDKDWNRTVQERFTAWADEQCDITGMLSLTGLASSVVGSWATSGGTLVNTHVLNNRYCKLELIEVERLRNKGNGSDTRNMVGGVESHPRTGRPVRYWVCDWNEQGTGLDFTPKPYDASGRWLVNNPRLRAAGQYRAAPMFTAGVDKIENLETAAKSSLGAFQLMTYIALAITRSQAEGVSTEDQLANYMVESGMASNVQEAKERGVWGPGTVLELMPGEGVQTINPTQPTTAWDVMYWTEIMNLLGEQGLCAELVFARFIRNYSASRSAIAVCWKSIRKLQKALVRDFLRPVYHWWLANEIRQGRIDALAGDAWKKVEFILPRMPVLDAKVETEAWLMQLAGGLKRHREVLLENGQGDRDQFMDDFKDERESNKDAELSYAQPTQQTESKSLNENEDENADA